MIVFILIRYWSRDVKYIIVEWMYWVEYDFIYMYIIIVKSNNGYISLTF